MYTTCALFVFMITAVWGSSINNQNIGKDSINEQSVALFEGLTDKRAPSLNLIHNGNKSYYIGDIFTGNFWHAEQFCRYHGMDLVTINSKEENDFLLNVLKSYGVKSGFWIGGTNLPDSNRWIWSATGRPIIYSNWRSGEPNNTEQKEHCAQVVHLNDGLLFWNDIDCYANMYFICEIRWTKDCHKLLDYLSKSNRSNDDIGDNVETSSVASKNNKFLEYE